MRVPQTRAIELQTKVVPHQLSPSRNQMHASKPVTPTLMTIALRVVAGPAVLVPSARNRGRNE